MNPPQDRDTLAVVGGSAAFVNHLQGPDAGIIHDGRERNKQLSLAVRFQPMEGL
jgi:hypothetical protein